MKRTPKITSITLLTAVVLAACGGGGGAGSAATAASAWFEAFTQFDFDRMKNLTCQSEQAAIDQGLSSLAESGLDVESFRDLLQIDMSGMKFEEKNVSGNQATVHVSGILKVTAFGQAQEQNLDEDVPMRNEGGAWKVCTGSLPLN